VPRPLALLVLASALALLACDGDANDAPSAGEPVASTASTPRSQLSVIEFVRADATVARLSVEVPPPTEYSIGLSGRRQLDERGMLFYYREVGRTSFWMKNTYIDLAIAFVSATHRIVEIREMRAEDEQLVTPGTDYQYAVEAPARWFRTNGVNVGDEARFTFPLPRELTGG